MAWNLASRSCRHDPNARVYSLKYSYPADRASSGIRKSSVKYTNFASESPLHGRLATMQSESSAVSRPVTMSASFMTPNAPLNGERKRVRWRLRFLQPERIRAGCYANRAPLGMSISTVESTTDPSGRCSPVTKHSEMTGPICFGGKFTTANTCLPNSVSLVYSSVICALDFFTPSSGPKSTFNL
jgi:hypothetical protein